LIASTPLGWSDEKAGARSAGTPISTACNSMPSACATSPIACTCAGALVAEVPSRAKRRPEGTSSFRIASRFASSSVTSMLTPVVLPPGRAKLAISPEATRSPVLPMIGIVLVAFCAARIAGSLKARITLAFARTSDWASSGKRSGWPSASRTSIRISRPSTSPTAANAFLNPLANGSTVSAVFMRTIPTMGRLSGF
jgi:hypothetical protein